MFSRRPRHHHIHAFLHRHLGGVQLCNYQSVQSYVRKKDVNTVLDFFLQVMAIAFYTTLLSQ